MKEIKDNDELLKIHNSGKGYIYNDYAGTVGDPNFNVLHESSCYTCNPDGEVGMKAHIAKFFFEDIKEAKNWLGKNRKDHYKNCGHCME